MPITRRGALKRGENCLKDSKLEIIRNNKIVNYGCKALLSSD